jgi:hypothetical protein
MVQQSKNDPDDVQDGIDDHAVDALRYGAVSQTAFSTQKPQKLHYDQFSAGWWRTQANPQPNRLLGSESVRRT